MAGWEWHNNHHLRITPAGPLHRPRCRSFFHSHLEDLRLYSSWNKVSQAQYLVKDSGLNGWCQIGTAGPGIRSLVQSFPGDLDGRVPLLFLMRLLISLRFVHASTGECSTENDVCLLSIPRRQCGWFEGFASWPPQGWKNHRRIRGPCLLQGH